MMKMRNSVCLTLVLCFGLAFATVPSSERQALVDFYTSLRGQNWVGKNNWLTGDPCENSWAGVTCGGGNTHVQQLSRQQQNLNGTISDSIGDLTQLEGLSLSFNPALVGTIPPFYVGLESLTSLILQSNGFTGTIPPNLGQTPNLSNLLLTENLTGTIPDDLFGAPYQSLTISGALLEGTLPDSFCKSPPSLVNFFFSQTQLSGTFPDCLDNFPLLQSFFVTQNSLSGPIPSTLTKLLELNQVQMHDNQLTGSLPDQLATTILNGLGFGRNQLVGTIPDYSSNFADNTTTFLSLLDNQLTGTIPDWVCDLFVFNAQGNQFQCPEPSCCRPSNCGVCQ